MKRFEELDDNQKKMVLAIDKALDRGSAISLYNAFVTILQSFKSNKEIAFFKSLATIKPYYNMIALIYILLELSQDPKSVEKSFQILERYTDHEIDVFMLVNLLNY